jgi:hypothetical protein
MQHYIYVCVCVCVTKLTVLYSWYLLVVTGSIFWFNTKWTVTGQINRLLFKHETSLIIHTTSARSVLDIITNEHYLQACMLLTFYDRGLWPQAIILYVYYGIYKNVVLILFLLYFLYLTLWISVTRVRYHPWVTAVADVKFYLSTFLYGLLKPRTSACSWVLPVICPAETIVDFTVYVTIGWSTLKWNFSTCQSCFSPCYKQTDEWVSWAWTGWLWMRYGAFNWQPMPNTCQT